MALITTRLLCRRAQTGTVLQAANADATATRIEADAFGAQAFFSGVCYGGTNASKTAITAGTQCGGYNSWLYNGTAVVGPLASLRTFANELQASAGTHGGTYLDITATPNGSQTPVSQMQIVPSAGGSGGGGGAGVNFALGTSHTPFALTDAATDRRRRLERRRLLGHTYRQSDARLPDKPADDQSANVDL